MDDKFKTGLQPERLEKENAAIKLELSFAVRRLDIGRKMILEACAACHEKDTICNQDCPLYKVSAVIL